MSCLSSCVSRPEFSDPAPRHRISLWLHAVVAEGKTENTRKKRPFKTTTHPLFEQECSALLVETRGASVQWSAQPDARLFHPGFAAAAVSQVKFHWSRCRIWNCGPRHSCTISGAYCCGKKTVFRMQNGRCCKSAPALFLALEEAAGASRYQLQPQAYWKQGLHSKLQPSIFLIKESPLLFILVMELYENNCILV